MAPGGNNQIQDSNVRTLFYDLFFLLFFRYFCLYYSDCFVLLMIFYSDFTQYIFDYFFNINI